MKNGANKCLYQRIYYGVCLPTNKNPKLETDTGPYACKPAKKHTCEKQAWTGFASSLGQLISICESTHGQAGQLIIFNVEFVEFDAFGQAFGEFHQVIVSVKAK